jgi:hypothetical protein
MALKDSDMSDYYTMWAHQIKIPISAMRRLLQNSGEMNKHAGDDTDSASKVDGPDSSKEDLIRDAIDWSSVQAGYNGFINGIVKRRETVSMDGGLLFIGIFFSIIFTMCLILIMYYKQISMHSYRS